MAGRRQAVAVRPIGRAAGWPSLVIVTGFGFEEPSTLTHTGTTSESKPTKPAGGETEPIATQFLKLRMTNMKRLEKPQTKAGCTYLYT